jgi:hypothetical protein
MLTLPKFTLKANYDAINVMRKVSKEKETIKTFVILQNKYVQISDGNLKFI